MLKGTTDVWVAVYLLFSMTSTTSSISNEEIIILGRIDHLEVCNSEEFYKEMRVPVTTKDLFKVSKILNEKYPKI